MNAARPPGAPVGRLILVRHGESFGNRDRFFANDPPQLALTSRGYTQADTAARLLARSFRVELVVSSPYVRAHETARIIAEILAVPLEIEPEFHEREVGVHRGQSYDSITAAAGFEPERPWRYRPQGGESFEDVRARVAPVFDALARRHPTGDVVMVSHGGVMMCLWAYVTGVWQGAHKPANCGMVVVEHGPAGYALPRVFDGAVGATDTGG